MGEKFLVMIQRQWEVILEQHYDFIDYVRPTIRKKPNLIIIHSGTNDIQNNVNTLQKIRKVISSIKEYDTDDNIKIALSSIIHRSDHDFEDKINETNRKLENLCKGKDMIFINNSNIDSNCLNRSKLHLELLYWLRIFQRQWKFFKRP